MYARSSARTNTLNIIYNQTDRNDLWNGGEVQTKLHKLIPISMNVPRSFLFLLYFLNIKRDTLISIRNFIRYIQHQLLLLLPAVMGSKESSPPTQSMEPPPPPPPPPFDPLKPSIPISFPLNTLEDLESRSYFKSFHYPFNKTSESAPPITSPLPSRSRMLVCHDMSGGYTGDKWVQGGANEGAYAIWHWYLIDVFVYFSHNLVTIPPPCWTNAAHTHGVKVLGTFITEWDEGRAICNTLLLTKESAELYAERLTELAVALGFDGWLINMEVELDVSQLPNLKVFVDHLTKTMHSSMPGSLVIWYDSVTIDGKLSWQNQLNDNNKPFFDLCDGIFVNYTWEKDYPKLSATVAGDRKYDVYMGIDVFGRNTYGGGQWTTNVALDVIKKDDVSAAVFAPGWVYETKQPPDFQTAQNRWWGLVEKSWGIRQYYPKLLPFYSNFDQGHGYHFSVDGGQISNDPWCNISCQSFQPVLSSDVGSLADTIQFMVNFKDASFSGGGNITFEGTLEGNAYFTTMLFRGELPLDHMPIQITHSVKSDGSSLLGLSLQFSSKLNEKTTILIADETTNQLETKFDKFITPHRYTNSPNNPQSWIIHNANISMNGYTLTEIHVVCYKSKAHLNKSKVDQPPKQEGSELSQAGTWTSSAFLRLLCCCCSSDSRIGTALTLSTASDYAASLGHISIKYLNRTSEFPPSSSWVVEGEDISWAEGPGGSKRVSLKLSWSLIEGDSSQYRSYNIYVKNGGEGEEYIGVARVRSFYVYGFRVEPSVLKVRFVVQVCGMDGVCQKVDSSPSFVLDIEV